jgi:hypothetical protein
VSRQFKLEQNTRDKFWVVRSDSDEKALEVETRQDSQGLFSFCHVTVPHFVQGMVLLSDLDSCQRSAARAAIDRWQNELLGD